MPADRSEIARKAAAARWARQKPPRDLSEALDEALGYVEIVPGVWQPQEMTAAERWKQQMRRRNGKGRDQ